MLQGHKFACVLAARAGSKRLKDKNLRKCAGKPLWLWTKEAVEAAAMFGRRILTTDMKNLDSFFIKSGWTSIGRPEHLAGEDAHVSDVMKWVAEQGWTEAEYMCLVSPTSPLRTGSHIREAAKLMLKEKADAVVAVAPCHLSQQDVLLGGYGELEPLYPSICDCPTHDSSQNYRLTGSIVIAKTELWLRKASIYNDPNIKTVGYVMPKWDIDIDNKDDLFMAEAMIECLRKRRTSLKSSIKSVLRGRSSKNSSA